MKSISSISNLESTLVGQHVLAIEHKILRKWSPYKIFFLFINTQTKEKVSTTFRVSGVGHGDHLIRTIKPKNLPGLSEIFLFNDLTKSIVKNYPTQE